MNGTIKKAVIGIAATLATAFILFLSATSWAVLDDVRAIKQTLEQTVVPLARDHETRIRRLEGRPSNRYGGSAGWAPNE